MIVARSSAPRSPIRPASCSSLTSEPAAEMAATESIFQTCRSPGRAGLTSPIVASCAEVSAKTATASESDKIHCTCSGDDVSYTGTVTAPAVQIA